MQKKLKKLIEKCAEQSHWPVISAARDLVQNPADLDLQINLIGAMHGQYFLKNRLKPYWKALGAHQKPWLTRCVQRLRQEEIGDHDIWACSAMLGAEGRAAHAAVLEGGFELVSIRWASTFEGKSHIATYAPCTLSNFLRDFETEISSVLAPVVEVGWGAKEGVINGVSRWRAIVMERVDRKGENLVGRGFGSYYLRASLPYGIWRVHEDDFQLKPEWSMRPDHTLLRRW